MRKKKKHTNKSRETKGTRQKNKFTVSLKRKKKKNPGLYGSKRHLRANCGGTEGPSEKTFHKRGGKIKKKKRQKIPTTNQRESKGTKPTAETEKPVEKKRVPREV